MTDVQRAPQQYKQPSRKGKRLGAKIGVLAERPAGELFTLDTTGSQAIKQDYVKKHKPLKADEILGARSAVPAVDTRKRKSTDGVVEPSSKRNKNGTYVPHRELQHLKNIAYAGPNMQKSVVVESVDHDPWAAESAPADPRFSFLEEAKPIKEPKTLKQASISLAANGKPFPAVKKPEDGRSYNPDFEAWEALIQREGEKEVEAERKRLKEAQEEAERLEKALAEAAKPDPVSDEEYESAWESEWEGIQSESEESHLNKKRPERKTQAERNKIKRRKEAERQAKWEQQMKKREEQQRRQLTAVVDESEASDDEEVLRRRPLGGKQRVPEAPLEVVLADELQDSLRALKPEGNLLKDRYRNMLLNGKIEARRTTQHRKPRREVTEKWTYKDWKLR
ncbi:hypothetical protein H2203_003026 [Taxawa tesnikishii (nom. ined.)]|nr:hypothetical protein H2203_003026 [Dothideales sp. JES 119]